jgi:hypothetical protein
VICSLYLVIERSKHAWKGPRIARVSKNKPTLPRPTEQAIVKLSISLPEDVLKPRVVYVEVKPEHIVAPEITASSQPAI